MSDDPEMAAKRARVLALLDGMQAVVGGVYLVLIVVVLASVGAVVYWLAQNATPDFGMQGEWLYVALGVGLVLVWGIGNVVSTMQQLRRTSARVAGHAAPLGLEMPGTLSLEWGSGQKQKAGTWTWKFESGPHELKTIRVDEAQLVMAASAATAGKDWDEICRVINSSYDSLSTAEQLVYRNAIQASVEARRPKT